MATSTCAGCDAVIEGIGVFQLSGDGAAVCRACFLLVENPTPERAMETGTGPRPAVGTMFQVGQTYACPGCLRRMPGPFYSRALDGALVCGECFPRSQNVVVMEKATYAPSDDWNRTPWLPKPVPERRRGTTYPSGLAFEDNDGSDWDSGNS